MSEVGPCDNLWHTVSVVSVPVRVFEVLLLLAFWLVPAILVARLAARKGRSFAIYLVASLLIGWFIPLIAALVVRPRAAQLDHMSNGALQRGLFRALAIALGGFAVFSVVGVASAIAEDNYASSDVVAIVIATILVLALATLAAWLARRSWRRASST